MRMEWKDLGRRKTLAYLPSSNAPLMLSEQKQRQQQHHRLCVNPA
jgi:hypothetical protein